MDEKSKKWIADASGQRSPSQPFLTGPHEAALLQPESAILWPDSALIWPDSTGICSSEHEFGRNLRLCGSNSFTTVRYSPKRWFLAHILVRHRHALILG